jgi:hypothetical protein
MLQADSLHSKQEDSTNLKPTAPMKTGGDLTTTTQMFAPTPPTQCHAHHPTGLNSCLVVERSKRHAHSATLTPTTLSDSKLTLLSGHLLLRRQQHTAQTGIMLSIQACLLLLTAHEKARAATVLLITFRSLYPMTPTPQRCSLCGTLHTTVYTSSSAGLRATLPFSCSVAHIPYHQHRTRCHKVIEDITLQCTPAPQQACEPPCPSPSMLPYT